MLARLDRTGGGAMLLRLERAWRALDLGELDALLVSGVSGWNWRFCALAQTEGLRVGALDGPRDRGGASPPSPNDTLRPMPGKDIVIVASFARSSCRLGDSDPEALAGDAARDAFTGVAALDVFCEDAP